jgi:tRNA A37 threonylcarbamoyladenosine dehydratase
MRHVARTRVDEEDDLKKSVDFVVDCADGNACITVKVEYFAYIQTEYITHILVKIVAPPA